MKASADVVVIGAGIIGASVAYNLAKKGVKNVVLVEREPFFAAWSTGKAAGGIRAQFSTEINVKISMLSEEIFERFQEEMKCDAAYDQVGYLFLLTTEEEKADFLKNVEMQKRLGLPVEVWSPEEVQKFIPQIRTDDLCGATFCKKDGLGDPYEFTQGYLNRARDLGVEMNYETEVTGLQVNSGKIKGVVTNQGTIQTDTVVNCAGAFAAQIGKMAGVDIPVAPIKRQVATTAPLKFIRPDWPMLVDIHSGLYTHKESGGLLLGWADKATPPGFDLSVDPNYTDKIIELALNRIPVLEEAEISSSWAGLYESTPDHLAILGKVPEVEGFILANGFSGHGFMHAPAVGVLLAELITEGRTSLDISALSIERFKKGSLEPERNVI
jgi:sarcosine oxidase subunit beta